MRFDPECAKNIMIYIEDNQGIRYNGKAEIIHPKDFNFDDPIFLGFTSDVIYYHVKQLVESKLLDADIHDGASPKLYDITDISPKGHDFLAAARSNTFWNKVIKYINDNGIPLTIATIIDVCRKLTSTIIGI